MNVVAYCYADGVIKFGKRCPKGALPIAARCGEHRLRQAILPIARRGYEPDVYLVPGIPEANNQMKAVDALIAFCRRVESSLIRGQEAGEAVDGLHACPTDQDGQIACALGMWDCEACAEGMSS